MPYRTLKVQLFPKPRQVEKLELNLQACRTTYNDLNEYCRGCIDRYREWCETYGGGDPQEASKYESESNPKPVFPSKFELGAKAGELREINLWRRGAYAASVWATGSRIYKAYQRWFDSMVTDSQAGLPRFRSEGSYDSYTYPQYPQYRFDTEGLFDGKRSRIYLGGVGWVRSSDTGLLKRIPVEFMKTAVVSRRKMGMTDKWYISVSYELPETPKDRTWYLDTDVPDSVGLDLGARRVATLSDGIVVENPRTQRKNEKKLARIQRKISKTEKGSDKRKKYLGHQNHLLKRIIDSKMDSLHKATRSIVREHPRIFVEDLSVKNLIELQDNKETRKLFRDASAGTFMRLLRYKGEESGSEIVPVDPAYTSRVCSVCGAMNDPGSSEIYRCRYCRLIKHRDDNASCNINLKGMGFDILGRCMCQNYRGES